MRRFSDWPERLDRFVAAARARGFEWGAWDCCLFAAAWVREATGTDVAAEYRGRYRTATGAARALKRICGGGVVEAATRALGMPLGSPAFAQRGDVAAVETEYGPALGVVIGARVAVVTPEGLSFLGLRAAETAWRV